MTAAASSWLRPTVDRATWDCARQHLDFFFKDAHVARYEDERNAKQEAQRCILRLYGVTAGGQSVYATTVGYAPWFLVRAPRGATDDDARRLLDALRLQMLLEAGVDEDEDETTMTASRVRQRAWQRKRCLSNDVLGVRLVHQQSLYGFTNGDRDAFVRLEFASMMCYYRVRGMLMGGDERTTPLRYLWSDGGGPSYRVEEAHESTDMRAIHDGRWLPSGWLRLTAGTYRHVEQSRLHAVDQYDVSCQWSGIVPLPDRTDIPPLRVTALDDEAYSPTGDFPKAHEASNALIQVGFITRTYYGDGSASTPQRTIFVLRTCDPVDADTDVRAFDPDEHGSEEEAEGRMLVAIQRYLVCEAQPDVLTGYNIWGFDLAYMVHRAELVGVVDEFMHLAPVANDRCKLEDTDSETKANGFNRWHMLPIEGVLQIDLQPLIRKEHKLRSYKLGYVSAHFLEGETKDDLKPHQIFEYHRRDAAHRAIVARYCLQDVWLCLRLLEKLTLLTSLISMSRVTMVPLRYLTTRGQQVKVRSQMTRHARAAGVALTSAPDVALLAMLHDDPRAVALRLRVGESPYTPQELLLPTDELIRRRRGSRVDVTSSSAPPRSTDAGEQSIDDVKEVMRRMASMLVTTDEDNRGKRAREDGGEEGGAAIKRGGDGTRLHSAAQLLSGKPQGGRGRAAMARCGTKWADQEREAKRKKKTPKYQGATVLDAKAGYYDKPVITLDFQSLYPSIIIAHNKCYTTLILDYAYWNVPGVRYGEFALNTTLYGTLTVRFVHADVQRGLLPALLVSLLGERARVRTQQKGVDKSSFEWQVLECRQISTKISANSVYGYAGALVGQQPCVPVALSVTCTGRTMIMLTKATIEREYADLGANVIYGDTDSVMVCFRDLAAVSFDAAFALGAKMAVRGTQLFTAPIKLTFEKVYYPYVLLRKKGYAGRKFMAPADPTAPVPRLEPVPAEGTKERADQRDVKGLSYVRRDGCLLVCDVSERVIDSILFDRDPRAALAGVRRCLGELVQGKVPMDRLVISMGLTKKDYDPTKALPPHVAVAQKRAARDEGDAPQCGDRVPYVVVEPPKRADSKKLTLADHVEDPTYALEHKLRLDTSYYIDNQLYNPLVTFLRVFPQAYDELNRAFDEARAHVINRRQGTTPIGSLLGGLLQRRTIANP